MSKKALAPFMQLLARDQPRIGGEVWPVTGENQQSGHRRLHAAFALQGVVQQFPHESVDGGVMLGSMDFRFPDQVRWETEGNVSDGHINKCTT